MHTDTVYIVVCYHMYCIYHTVSQNLQLLGKVSISRFVQHIIQDQTHAIVEMVETRHCGTRGWRTAKVAIGLCFSKHCVRDLDDGGKTSWTILEVAALGEKLEVLIND